MLSRDFSTKRKAFGKIVKDHSLHIKTLADMEVSPISQLHRFYICTRLIKTVILGYSQYNIL